jgi:hypothetical protein
MRGTELLAHMCKIRNRSIGGAKVGVSDHLGVDLTDVQRAILRPSETDLALDGAQRKMPTRRMNALGEINSHCVNGNSADRLGLIKEALTLGQSLEEVSRVQGAAKAAKSADAMKDMHQKAPAAIDKYVANNGDASKLTISDLETIAAVEFCVTLKGKGKAQKVAAFESLATARMWTGGAGATAVAQGQQWIGRPVRKNFDGAVHEGSVIAFDSAEGLFVIKYADGDQEDVELDELMEITGDKHVLVMK